jgi:hypothetical protein
MSADLPDPEDAPSECTEFTTEVPDEVDDDGKFLFSFVCPRCEDLNALEGDPRDFATRPFRCLECNYVPLLVEDALEEFATEHYDDTAKE